MVISFYSYKGGVGRSQLLVNVAACLSYEYHKKVLLIDWDLEAPGLPYFFPNKGSFTQNGVIDLFTSYIDFIKNPDENGLPEFNNDYIQNVQKTDIKNTDSNTSCLHLISAGKEIGYYDKLYLFNWDLFYNDYDGKKYIEWIKNNLINKYDYILIDSRTGISDYSGIANIQLPDVNIFVVAPTEQNFKGASQVAKYIKESDYVQKKYREGLILPILSRVDPFLQEKVNLWGNNFKNYFKPFFEDIFKYIQKPLDSLDSFINESFIEYNSELSFGENLLFPIDKDKEGPINTFTDKIKAIVNVLEEIKTPQQLQFKKPFNNNIIYSNIQNAGNIYIGQTTYNIGRDFSHSMLFIKLEKAQEENTLLAQLSIKSKQATITELLHQKVKVDIDPALFKQVAGFQEVRRLGELTFRGLGHITPENIRIEEEYLAEQLFSTFFQGDILTVCQDFIALLEKRKISELMLAVSCEDNAVVNLPFEMVIPKFFPEKLGERRQSLAVNHFGFVRTLETSLAGFEMQGKPSDAAPLKLLFVTALPENLSERSKMLEIEEEQKRLIDAIGSFEATGGQPKLVIEFLDTASLQEINDALQKHQHHIVHITGHGSYNAKTNQGVLHLEDDEGKHLEVTGAQLGEVLRQHEYVKLLILSAGETAIAGNGVVEQLATFGIPALVAMRFSVTDEAAKVFTTALYAALAKGETLTLAIAQAREALWQRLEEQRRIHPDYIHLAEWFTPITYLNQYTEALVNLKDNYVLPEDFYPRSDFFKTKNTRLIGAGFVGRKRYLNQLRRHFAQGKHVCLHGLGGLGKTTLAEAFANNYDNQSHELLIFRGGNQLFEKSILDELFARLESDEKANNNTVRYLKNYLESDAAATEKLQSLITNYLQNRKIILVFDNFEDVLRTEGGEQQCEIGSENLREFYQYLCQNTPSNCHLLFTSRYTIADLSTMVTHLSLDKMTYAEQYRLSNFSPTLRRIPMSDRQEVFKRLDGHPRAYEFLEALLKNDAHLGWENVAASMGKVESQVVENLLLTKIYDRLSPDAQQLLQMASVFITRTPLAALEHLTPPTGTALLTHLADWSLCFVDDNEHFEIQRLTREWVTQQKISPDQRKAWALKAGDYFVEQPTWDDDELAKEYYEIAEAWEKFADVTFRLEGHYRLIGFYPRALELNQAVLSKPISEKNKAMAYNSIGLILKLYGQLDNALDFYEQSLKIQQAIGDRKGEGTTLNNISQIYNANGDYETALSYLEQSLKIQQAIGDRKGEGTNLNNLATMAHAKGDYETALSYLEQSLKIQQAIGDRSGEGTTLNNISQIYNANGDYETALSYLEQSLKIQQAIGDRKGEGTTLNNISQIYNVRGDYETALSYLEQSLKIQQAIGDRSGEGTTLNNISQIYNVRGDYETALSYLEQSLKIQQAIGDRKGEGTTLNNISQIFSAKGDYETALSYLEQSLKIRQAIGDRKGEGTTLNNISQIYNVRGDYETALSYLEQSLKIQQAIGDRSGEGTTLNNISQIYNVRGDYETALSYLEQSLKIQQAIGDRKGEGTNLNNISQIYKVRGDYETALSYLEQSLKIRQSIGDRSGEGTTLNNISQIFSAKGDYETALSYLQESLKIQQSIGDRSGEGTTLNNISQIYNVRGDYETALSYLEQSLKIQQAIGDISDMAATLHNMGAIAFGKSDWELAIPYFLHAYQILEKIGSPNAQHPLSYLNAIFDKIGEFKFQEIMAKMQ